jgi:hypothetical protein
LVSIDTKKKDRTLRVSVTPNPRVLFLLLPNTSSIGARCHSLSATTPPPPCIPAMDRSTILEELNRCSRSAGRSAERSDFLFKNLITDSRPQSILNAYKVKNQMLRDKVGEACVYTPKVKAPIYTPYTIHQDSPTRGVSRSGNRQRRPQTYEGQDPL